MIEQELTQINKTQICLNRIRLKLIRVN